MSFYKMVLQIVEFRYPPFKFKKSTDAVTGKAYFENLSDPPITNLAIKTTTTKTEYSLESISIVSGRFLLQAPNDIYLVTKNVSKSGTPVFLCFKLVQGSNGLDVFNDITGIKRIDIDAAIQSAPSNNIIVNAAENIIILDAPVTIDKMPLLSKYHNIITQELGQIKNMQLTSVKQVKTTANCETVSLNSLPKKQRMTIHVIMICITFLVAVGAFVYKAGLTGVPPLINKVLLVLWGLLVTIVVPTAKYSKKINTALKQTILVTKYLVTNIGIMLMVLNWGSFKLGTATISTNMAYLIKEWVFNKIINVLYLIGAVVGIYLTGALFLL